MSYAGLVLGVAQLQIWSITAALPSGAGGTRAAVGFPEVIPDVTFLARPLTAADGNFSPADRTHFNGYTSDARAFHTTYGLPPVNLNSLEHLLDHPQLPTGQIGRIRLISHGSAIPDTMLFLPVFNGGLWDFGMPKQLVDALIISDEAALRFLLSGGTSATQSPLLVDIASELVNGIRAITTLTVLQPFGLQPTGTSPSPELRTYFEVVSDLYQVQFGTIVVGTAPATTAQRATLATSLTIIENAVRGRLDGTTAGGVTLHSTDLQAFKNAVLARAPGELGFLGPTPTLPATVIADLQATLAASQPDDDARIDAIRTAITGFSREPVLNRDYLGSVIDGLTRFSPAVLNLGGTARDEGDIRGNINLQAFALIAIDLHHLKNAPVLIDGPPARPATAPEKATLRGGLMEIANLIRGKIPGPITVGQLNNLRDAIENLDWTRSTLTGALTTVDQRTLRQLSSANASLQGGFRTKLTAFRARMQPADASKVDIRGCLVGSDPTFLTSVRDLLGTNTNKPVVTAPDFFQSFPFASYAPFGVTMATIDALVASGLSSHRISAADVDTAITDWRALIDFDPHFDFIAALFAAGASKIDFASLDWRVWRTAAAPAGIPMLKMEAPRVDDLTTRNLGELIERFGIIFEIASAHVPNATVRGRLNQLQPFLVAFRTIRSAVAAAAAPTPAQLGQFQTDLSALATSIIGIAGFAAPSAPLVPPNAAPTLPDIQGAVGRIRTHLDTILGTALNTFFTDMQAKTGHVNARIRYYYNIGLPLLLKSSAAPTSFAISILMSGLTADLARKALRSWMRIAWEGTPAQAATMNTAIQAMTNLGEMSRVSMLTDEDPLPGPGDPPVTDSGIHPTQAYHDHIVTRP